MFDKDTPPGTLVICVKNGPLPEEWKGQPKLTVNALYTVKETFISERAKKVGFHLEEVEVFKIELGGEVYQAGYDSDWFRPLDKHVIQMEADGNQLKNAFKGMPSPVQIQNFEEMKSFFKAVRKLKRKEGE